MAKQQSQEELNIKSRARRRLIGAAALALAVVVILPMVLDREPRPSGQDIDLRIPAPDKVGEFVPGKALSQVVDEAARSQSAVSASSAVAEETTKPEAKQPEVKPVEAMPAEVRHAESKSAAGKQIRAAYVVQVGAFANASAASQEAKKLKALGYKAYTEAVSGTTRVRLGPYADRKKADDMRKSLEKHGFHPVVKEDE
jgi:DedD protein